MALSPDFRVNISVSDFPLFVPIERHFEKLKEAGVDGVELVPGYKSRSRIRRVKNFAERQGLSVDSIHQPFWSVAGLKFDERLVWEASMAGINTFVYHPLADTAFEDEKMQRFTERLSGMQLKYGVSILIENMARVVRPKLFKKFLPFDRDVIDPLRVAQIVSEYGLGMTFDTSHAFVPNPHKEKWFEAVYPRVKNIHLSSFIQGKDHLPLNMGNFNARGFTEELSKRKYSGLITLEINYPRMFSYTGYNYGVIRDSVEVIKSKGLAPVVGGDEGKILEV